MRRDIFPVWRLHGEHHARCGGLEDSGNTGCSTGRHQHLGLVALEPAPETTVHRETEGRARVDRGTLEPDCAAEPDGGDAGGKLAGHLSERNRWIAFVERTYVLIGGRRTRIEGHIAKDQHGADGAEKRRCRLDREFLVEQPFVDHLDRQGVEEGHDHGDDDAGSGRCSEKTHVLSSH